MVHYDCDYKILTKSADTLEKELQEHFSNLDEEISSKLEQTIKFQKEAAKQMAVINVS